MLPTFIVAGAGKSGTTSLWQYLRVHPQVCMSRIKETNFFATQGINARYYKGLSWYMGLFDTKQGCKIIGEVSPSYLTRKETPFLIHQTLPDVQLIFVLRDPVERIYSRYWFDLQRGLELPKFETMVQQRHPQFENYVYNGQYHQHLGRFLTFFPQRQIQVYLFDNLRREPLRFIQCLYHSIGVERDFVPPNLGKRYNQASIARVNWVQRKISNMGSKVMHLDLPPWLYLVLRFTRAMIWRVNTVPIAYQPLDPELRQRLILEFSESIDFVEAYLDQPLPAWRQA